MPDLEPPIEKLGYGAWNASKIYKIYAYFGSYYISVAYFFGQSRDRILYILLAYMFCTQLWYSQELLTLGIANLHHIAMYSYDSCSHVQ